VRLPAQTVRRSPLHIPADSELSGDIQNFIQVGFSFCDSPFLLFPSQEPDNKSDESEDPGASTSGLAKSEVTAGMPDAEDTLSESDSSLGLADTTIEFIEISVDLELPSDEDEGEEEEYAFDHPDLCPSCDGGVAPELREGFDEEEAIEAAYAAAQQPEDDDGSVEREGNKPAN